MSNEDVDEDVNVDVNEDADEDGDGVKEKGAKAPKKKNFVPPTVEEVEEYCRQNGKTVDPQAFVDYYESNGWMVGRNKMKSWKSAVGTWEHRNKQQARSSPKPRSQLEYLLDSIREDESI